MVDPVVISRIGQISDGAFMELKLRLDPFFLGRAEKNGGGGGITEITSDDGTLVVENGTGPVVNLLNEAWLFNRTNGDSDAGLANGWGWVEFRDTWLDPYQDDPRALLLWDKTQEDGIMLLAWKNFGMGTPEPTFLVVKEGSIQLLSLTATGGTVSMTLDADGILTLIPNNGTATWKDNGGNVIFEIDEATGVTSGTFDGGAP